MNTEILKLDPMAQMMLQQRIKEQSPNTIIAYVLLLLTGLIGGHLYYCAYKSRGGLRVAFIIGGVVYTCTLALSFTMWFFDLIFCVIYCNMIKKENEDIIINEYLVANGLGGKVTPKELAKDMDNYDAWKKKG